MKKFFLLCLAMLMVVLAGCENSQQKPIGYENGNVQNMYVYYNDTLYIYTAFRS